MGIEAHPENSHNPFQPARDAFEGLLSELSSRETLSLTHSAVEELLVQRGQELMRRAFQGHLDLRGPGRVLGAVESAEGIALPYERAGRRNLETQFGGVCVERFGYYARDEVMAFPLDGDLNLPGDLYSFGVRRRVAKEVTRGSYDEAVSAVGETTGASVPKRQAEALASRAAQDFDAFYEQRVADRDSAFTDPLLVLSVDGKGVPMRREHLREATRRQGEEQRHKLATKLSKGEKTGSKRMSTVAVVHTVEPYERTPEQFVADLRGTLRESPPQRPRPTNRRAWASIEKSPNEVIADAFAEALKRDPLKEKDWIGLVDGNETQIECLERQAWDQDIDLTIVLDLMHVLGYLWKASHVFNAEGSAESEDWVYERLLQILHGRAGYVAGGIRRSATKRGLRKKDRAAADTCAAYLLKYRAYMRYDLYLTRGWPICTGAVEGACRHIVQDRLGKTGARWSLHGAEAVLRLRSLHTSGDFDAYWAFHENRERQRNHEARYTGGIPAITRHRSTVAPPNKLRVLRRDCR
jgi:hypothetical protein